MENTHSDSLIFNKGKGGKSLTEMQQKRQRVLIGKLGLDGHERGAMVVSMALRDAGMEVIYSGIRRTPEQIAATALQEDVNIIGFSSLSGGHLTLIPLVLKLLKEKGVTDIKVIAGGLIPEEDVPVLKSAGVKEVFGPGTPTDEIVRYVKDMIAVTGS